MFNLLSQTVGYIMNNKVVEDDKKRKEQKSAATTSSSYTGYSTYEPKHREGENGEEFLTRSFNEIFGQ